MGAVTLFDTGGGGNTVRTLRGGVFFLFAISAMLPILQSVIELGWTRASNEIGLGWYLAEALSLLTGTTTECGRKQEKNCCLIKLEMQGFIYPARPSKHCSVVANKLTNSK
ncbi:hypothetical protein VN97_g2171 [Penicillium thymicola]|uniref:Uncharacterized protein n=1 Tax=Penicillium thymicola TaxID=293382 RepID=A0AAI9XBP2_PENTH|nr:hypothetical protein VN97_g2171 [Penicillium thymicola]